MSPSLGLVFALFLLAPGLGFFAGLYLRGQRAGIHAAPPPPSSFTALAVVGLSALAAHTVGALSLSAVRAPQGTGPGAAALRFYETAASLAEHGPHGTASVAGFLLFLSALTLASWIAGWAAHRLAPAKGLLYGWLADMEDAVGGEGGRFVIAYVLSTIENDGVRLGYQGLLRNIILDSEREIRSLVLVDVDRFTHSLTKRGQVITRAIERDPLNLLKLEREDIANAVFEVFEFGAPDRVSAADHGALGGLVRLARGGA
ncbi:MAG: hypothetical protein RQ833_11875 [Sphingomonadaceae bacterium]|nr:hypothetical protein [Sphingomonadaceae bacterium]